MDDMKSGKVKDRIEGRGYSVEDIKRRIKDGESIRSIARKLGLEPREISRWAKA